MVYLGCPLRRQRCRQGPVESVAGADGIDRLDFRRGDRFRLCQDDAAPALAERDHDTRTLCQFVQAKATRGPIGLNSRFRLHARQCQGFDAIGSDRHSTVQ